MKNLLTSFCLILLSTTLVAHNPLTSRFELRASLEEGALLDIYLTQFGLHQALLKNHPGADFEQMGSDEYKQLTIQYLKEHIHLVADGEVLQLSSGAIKLGDHQTDLKFFVENYREGTQELEVNIDAFKENGKQQTVFWWYTAEESSKVVLSHKNDFETTMEIGDQGVEILEGRVEVNWKDAAAVCGLLAILCIMLLPRLVVKKRL